MSKWKNLPLYSPQVAQYIQNLPRRDLLTGESCSIMDTRRGTPQEGLHATKVTLQCKRPSLQTALFSLPVSRSVKLSPGLP